jgi:shikimate kinase
MSRKLLDKNLYLIGFMGTGKSTAGRKVAEKLRYKFIDSDHEIERIANSSIPDIFKNYGETYFRNLEKEFIVSGHPEQGCVVSCGGGLVCHNGMIDVLKEKGVVICLWASVEDILARTSMNQNRPLLNVESPREKIISMIEARTPFYNQAHGSLTTEFRTVSEVVQHIVRMYISSIRSR